MEFVLCLFYAKEKLNMLTVRIKIEFLSYFSFILLFTAYMKKQFEKPSEILQNGESKIL